MILHNIQQRTPEWSDLRVGRFGGSMANLFAVGGKEKIGKGLETAIIQNVADRILGDPVDNYVSMAMQDGIDREPDARLGYETLTMQEVREIGYVSEGDWFGCSPDGFVGKRGMIEIKCPQGREFMRFKITKEVDKSTMAQMQWNMMISDKDWCDLVIYHPEGGLLMERVKRDTEWIELFQCKMKIVEERIQNIIIEFDDEK